MQTPLKQTSRELFKAAASGAETPRPPFWIMRQAGRFLPEYRELKKKHSFVEITQTPELAVEATLQPIRRFDFDCAIVFSDILVVAEALGFPYAFRDGGGIKLPQTVDSEDAVKKAEDAADSVAERLDYVRQAVRILRRELPDKALYGFCGAPWTLACYMVEGGSAQGFPKFASFAKSRPDLFKRLMAALSKASASYAKMQAQEGIDAFQVFDSHAALTPEGGYFEMSGRWIKPVFDALGNRAVGVIFANGMSQRMGESVRTGAAFYSLDASRKLSEVRAEFDVGLQGNLPPEILGNSTPEEVARRTREIVEDMRGKGRHIFNLAHGIRPDAKLENVEALCQTIREF